MTKQDYRYLIAEITKLFFRDKEFKIFDVSPEGWFISLGLTTSLETLEKLKNVFKNSDYNFKVATLAELKSVKNGETYENSITRTEGLSKFDSEGSIKEGCFVYGEEKKSEYPQLAEIIESSEGSWNNYAILISPDKGPVIFYKKINYKRLNESTELRIGIYVVPEIIT